MKTIQLLLAGLLIAFSHSSAVHADDIDIYSGLGGAAGVPNVLFILDNSASLDANAPTCNYADGTGSPSGAGIDGKLFGMEMCSLYNVIYALPTNTDGSARVNIGLMYYNGTGITNYDGNNNCQAASNNGGCLAKPLTPMTVDNKAAFMAWIKKWTASTIKTNNEKTASAMYEAWAYYSGNTGPSGLSYAGVKPTATCANNFVIFIGNAANNVSSPGDGSGSTAGAALQALYAAAGTTYPGNITIPSGSYGLPGSPPSYCSTGGSTYTMGTHNESSGLYADEWARYMNKTDIYGTLDGTQNITTYTVGVLGPTGCKPDYPALLSSMAANGGTGKYYPTDASSASDLVQNILKILNEVQAVNSVFASSSLPVSVNAQGTYLNQVFMGMFRPDASGLPRWPGNLKQYQFVYDSATQNIKLGDSLGVGAIAGGTTGFISPDAVSFWTCTNTTNPYYQNTLTAAQKSVVAQCSSDPTNGFWQNAPSGASGAYDLADGEVVEKGGVAQQLRLSYLTSQSARKLYTYCPSGTGCNDQLTNSANAFTSSNGAITDAMLGTGARTVTSITSASTVTATSAAAGTTISITAFSKSSSTVTATVSSTDIAKVSVGASITISTGAAAYDCTPCTVASVDTTTNTFTYSKSGGAGTPTTPYTAIVNSSTVVVTKASHGLSTGQYVTFASASSCTTLTGLNGQVVQITAATTNTFTVTAPSAVYAANDTTCKYTSNTATVTSNSHGFPSNASVVIAGASPSGYNGTYTITVTGANTFTYQYLVAAPLGSASGTITATGNTTKANLIDWVRGNDNFGDEKGPGGTVTVRPSIHGDVLHSRPVVINYGGASGAGPIVFYGANDGVYRAVKGAQTGTGAGNELWGFIPSEFFGKLYRLRNNSPELLLPTTPGGIIPTPQPKDYFVDGATGLYQVIAADGTTSKAWIYTAMRRGGRFIYALDVTDPTAPIFKWKKGYYPNGTCNDGPTTGDKLFCEMGQTWSAPKVAFVKGYANPVLILGAGYDTAEDSEPPASNTMGRGIFILDALTGDVVWSATHKSTGGATSCSGTATQGACLVQGMDYSIPADISLIDRDGDGKIDRLYATDVGGNVWRVDIEPTISGTKHTTPDYWQINKIAALGCTTGVCASGTTPRKFFYPADLAPYSTYDAVLVGSGDREHPLLSSGSYNVTNRFYMLKDESGDNGSGQTVITEQTSAGVANLFDATSVVYNDTLNGYYLTFGSGEKAVNAPTTVAGITYFGTNQPVAPSANSCSATLGIARSYHVRPLTGNYNYSLFNGGGLPPSPVSGLVQMTIDGKPALVPFVIGGGTTGGSNLDSPAGSANGGAAGGDATKCTGTADECAGGGGGKPKISITTTRTRTYWYQELDK